MALPQTVDQSTLNLSGKPAISTAAAPTITSPGSTGMASPTIATETTQVSPAAGALMGYLLGNYMDRTSGGASSGTGTGIGGLINSIFGSKTPTTGTPSGGGTSTPTNAGNTVKPGVPAGNTPGIGGTSVNSISLPAGTDQATIDAKYGTTNGQSNYVISGVNMSNGSVIATPNYNIGGANLGTPTDSTGTHTYDPASTTNTDITASQDYQGYFQNSNGDIYNANGDLLMIKLSDGNWYDPFMDSYFDPNFMPIDTGSVPSADTSYSDWYNSSDSGSYYTPTDTTGSPWDYTPSTDTSVYSPIDTTIGPTWKKGGLATPLFKHGGNVKGYADGNLVTATPTSFTDQVVANQMPQSSGTSSATGTNLVDNTTGGGTSILGALGNLFSTGGAKGAALGALLTQLIGSSTQPVNKGVDMTALSSMKPRTTPFGMGAAKYVPYSEYGTPTGAADYSTLFQNLGVSPFNAGTTAPAVTSTAMPAISTAPAGGLSIAPSSTPVATPAAPSAPAYYTDGNGNIYDANGDLVYDSTAGSVVSSPAATSSVATSSPATTSAAANPYYSYGTPVTPANVLGAKKGGLAKMADGGTTSFANPFTGAAVSANDLFDAIQKDSPLMEAADINNLIATDPYKAQAYYNTILQKNDPSLVSGTVSSPVANDALDTFYNSMSNIDPSQYDNYFSPGATYSLGNYGDITGQQIQDYFTMRNNQLPQDVAVSSTGTDFIPVMYNQGMPQQVEDLMPTQGGLMPPQDQTAMPTQGSAMPQQTPFSTSPTFKYSGANNPLLTGLRQGTPSQPYMLMPDGTFAPREEISKSRAYGYALGGQPITDNLNVPVSNRPFANVPAIQGRGDYRQGAYVEGAGDGQSDDIPAMLADGEYVIDAETVAQLGNGSNKAGAKVLDEFRKNIRAHKRSAPHDKIPPKSKSPLAYLKGVK